MCGVNKKTRLKKSGFFQTKLNLSMKMQTYYGKNFKYFYGVPRTSTISLGLKLNKSSFSVMPK